MTFETTLLSAVNTWECDENNHMNVQFYAEKFDASLAALSCSQGFAATGRRFRVIRYARELMAGEAIRVESAVSRAADGRACVVHMMRVVDDGVLSASAIDILPLPDERTGDAGPPPPETLPRGALFAAEPLVALSGHELTFRGQIRANDLDAAGRLTDRALVGLFSDAAPAAWGLAGMTTTWLKTRNLGRVAVEMALSYGTPPQADDTVSVYSVILEAAMKTVTFRHLVINDRTGAMVGAGRATSLALSYETRRAIVLPEDARAAIELHLRQTAR